MSAKQFYFSPETKVIPLQPEGPLCTSDLSVLMETALSDYDLLDASDIVWDD